MRNRLPKTSHHIAICEANFIRLSNLLTNFIYDEYEFEATVNETESQYISFLVLERTKHTLSIEAKQNNKIAPLSIFTLRIKVFIDARMAEVSSYQSEKPLPFFYKKSAIQSKDEKNQQNRFLTEWLESIFISGMAPKSIIEKILNE
tara:strand:+ start:4673 stop:5113 length:441 start_codon:yes stop_codon:yes gene_type:complete